MRFEGYKVGRDGEPPPRDPTPQEIWETDPERRRKIDEEHARIGEKYPKKARPNNKNNKTGKNGR